MIMMMIMYAYCCRAVVANGEDLTAREDLAIASVFGKLSIPQFYY